MLITMSATAANCADQPEEQPKPGWAKGGATGGCSSVAFVGAVAFVEAASKGCNCSCSLNYIKT